MKGLSKIDFTDGSRQGAHTAKYIHDEIIDYLKYQEYDLNPAATSFPYVPRVEPGGDFSFLNLFTQYQWPNPTNNHDACQCLVTREWLPRNFIFDFWGGYVGWDAGIVMNMAIVKDLGNSYNYATGPAPYRNGLKPPAFVKWGTIESYLGSKAVLKKTNGLFEEFPSTGIPTQNDIARCMLIRRNERVFYVSHKTTGEFLFLHPVKKSSEIEDGLFPDRLILPQYTYNFRNSYWRAYQIGLEEYKEYNAAIEPQVAVTTTGTPTGAGDAKTAVTQGDETSLIILNPGQEINVNMTSGNFDVATWAVEVVSDCSDTNMLDISFATSLSANVYSGIVQIGNTRTKFDCGDKIADSWTYTTKHIFYQHISYLFNVGFNASIGFKRMKIKNNSAVILRVFLFKVIAEPTNSGIYDSSGRLTYMHVIDPNNAPLGTPGSIQTLSWRNSSGYTALSLKLSITDDGSPLNGLIQFSGSLSGPWYDTNNPPPGGELTLGTNIIDGGTVPFYVRTNLPITDPQLSSFIAKFKFKIQT